MKQDNSAANHAAAMTTDLSTIRVVLVRPSHPGNIGAAARAMKTMGLTQMVLVAPQLMQTPMTAKPMVFDAQAPQSFRLPEESYQLASGAGDVLDNAKVYASIREAVADCVDAYALSSRRREITLPATTPRQVAAKMITMAKQQQGIALVFGNERTGLTIDEVMHCNRLLTIQGNPAYFSLNLAQAVQVVAYELCAQYMLHLPDESAHESTAATRVAVEGLGDHFEALMDEVGFFERRNRERLMRRVRHWIDRSAVQKEEVDILRGFLTMVQHKISRH